jgi:hypothetical protein
MPTPKNKTRGKCMQRRRDDKSDDLNNQSNKRQRHDEPSLESKSNFRWVEHHDGFKSLTCHITTLLVNEPVTCGECNKSYEREALIKASAAKNERKAPGTEKHTCLFCTKPFAQSPNLLPTNTQMQQQVEALLTATKLPRDEFQYWSSKLLIQAIEAKKITPEVATHLVTARSDLRDNVIDYFIDKAYI